MSNYLNELEDEDEEEDLDVEEKKILSNIKNIENPDSSIKAIISGWLDEKDKDENLINKTLQVYEHLKFKENDIDIYLLQTIFTEAFKFSSFNLVQRLSDFFDFLLDIEKLNIESLTNALNIKLEDLDKNNKKDILNFWKYYITEDYLKKSNSSLEIEPMKNNLKLLLEHNFNINGIESIFESFSKLTIHNNYAQYEIINSLISTLILYRDNIEEFQSFINQYIKYSEEENELGKKESKLVLDENVALEFYLKVSQGKESNILSKTEILQNIRINNSNVSEERLSRISAQVDMINKYVEDQIKDNNFNDIKSFKDWTMNQFQRIKNDYSDKAIAEILAVISLAINFNREDKEKKKFLRETQIIAILLFISKEKNRGLIEEIATGEGKSCIICSLSIYYALRGHKVDIISSSYILAKRDSNDFRNLYNLFNLTTNYPFDSQPEPYKANILYGTFLEFEGDYLREITSDDKIRNNRKYDVIIIDEVDNLFIDNILGSTRLTGSSRGFKFLIPIYLTIYILFDIINYFFLLFFKLNLNNVNDTHKKNKYEVFIKNPKKRKKEIINMLTDPEKFNFNGLFKDIQDNNNTGTNEIVEIVDKQTEDLKSYFINLKKYVEFPDFMKSFVESQVGDWYDSAYDAKNIMELDRDYVEVINKKGYRDIAPVDRNNTGEIELQTVYGEGLHQMLEIKHKLRVKDETLVHTFLSHITFFEKYKNNDEFLFFGLTGTIGNKETQKIFREHFNSNLLFIPQYKRKRFVELPPLLVNINEHLNLICKDILINFYKGRKILVICSSIKEAKFIEEELKRKNRLNLKELNISPDLIKEKDYRDYIILYTRSDTEESNIKIKGKKIILSTNLGGRGTDIKTDIKEEEAGGLHVILTYIPANYRVLKQAFGRTSREGKKGTAQIILQNIKYKSYSDVINEMNENEKEQISYIQKRLKILLFKDKLYEEYIGLVKDVDYKGYLIDDINERWAHFLKNNLRSDGDNLNMIDVKNKFEDFKKKIKVLLKQKEEYLKFENPFYKMQEGLRLYSNYEYGLKYYFDFDVKIKKFFFVQPYVKAAFLAIHTSKYNDKFFYDVNYYLDEAINRIELLIEENLNPILKSFDQWDNIISNLESTLNIDGNYDIINDLEKPFAEKNFINSDLFKQYTNIKLICDKIINKIRENKHFFENFKDELKKDKSCEIFTTIQSLEDGLSLTDEEMKEQPFFDDATFRNVYQFSIRKKSTNLWTIFGWIIALGIITVLSKFIGTYAAFIVGASWVSAFIVKQKYTYKRGREISNDSLFGNLFVWIFNKISNNNKKNVQRNVSAAESIQKDNKMINSVKNNLFENIIKYVDLKFINLKKDQDLQNLINFLIFIDYYYYEDKNLWQNKILKIFSEQFDKIYKTLFKNNNYFKSSITKSNMQEHLKQYQNILDIYLDSCIKEIINLGNKKTYNKNDGMNCLEHLIIDLNSEEIKEEYADKIVKNILENGVIKQNGEINKNLFKEIFIIDKNTTLEQKVKINIINKIQDNKIKIINDKKSFRVTGFEIPLVNSSFIDLSNFYHINGYNVQNQLEKDFSIYIINNLKKIIINLVKIDPTIFKKFNKYLLNFVKALVKNLLQEKIFSRYKINSFENVITSELTNEERIEFNKLINEAQKDVINIIKGD